MLAATFGDGQVAYAMLWFFLFFIEIWLMITVFIDIFRSHDLKGWAKAIWLILVLVLPLIGIVAYLILRGGRMRAHAVQTAQEQEQAFRSYVQDAAGTKRSAADELARLAELKERGVITEEEFRRLKGQVVAA